MIRRAYVQVEQVGKPESEARALLEALAGRGVEVETFTAKRMRRRQLDVRPDTLVSGYVDVVRSAFKILGAQPSLATYPESLRSLLGRRVWRSTAGEVQASGTYAFVKPADDEKRFTGYVIGRQWGALERAPRRLSVWCSEVVEIELEHRAYVVDGVVRGVCRYAGEGADEPPADFLHDAIERMRAAGELVAGFAIDVGRLDDGRWVLVECNDGFGLGLYEGLAAHDYADLLCARWSELVS